MLFQRTTFRIIRRRIISQPKNATEVALQRQSEQLCLRAFQRAAQHVPWYRQHLERCSVKPAEIIDIERFKSLVPLLDKEATFHTCRHSIRDLCVSGSLAPLAEILTSSGHSGIFSFGLSSRRESRHAPGEVDFALDCNFNVSTLKTLLINCLPMGVQVPSKMTVTAHVSVRSDMALALVRGFTQDFDQIILVGENSFIKKILEDGIAEGIQWPLLNIKIIVGEEGFPEGYRDYLFHLLGVDHRTQGDNVVVGSSMGISELGLSIFQETRDTIRLRRAARSNPPLSNDLFGTDRDCPMLFVYHPTRFYVEEHDTGGLADHSYPELVVTNLSSTAMLPLIRYKPGDHGRIIPYERIKDILSRHNLAHLLPEFHLPLVAISGRGAGVRTAGCVLFPEDIKYALYADQEIAGMITGNFKLTHSGPAIQAEIQLRPGVSSHQSLADRLETHITAFSEVPVTVTLFPFSEFPYPLDYEKKFKYID